MTEKKISFGFKMVKKQPLLLPIKSENDDKKNDVELIQCLEGQTIKLVHEKEQQKALVIPCLNSQKTSTALASLRNLKKVLDGEEQEEKVNDEKAIKTEPNDEKITLEQRVIKELLNEGKNAGDEDENAKDKLTLPMAADQLPLEGATESTLDDYDNIPISQFGFAMLRGMGLKDEDIKSKQNKDPELRPKGMGLGADKVVKKAKLLVQPAVNEVLEIKKNAYVRVLAGKHKDLYGQIEGLDDHACRVIVKLALGGAKEVFNEFMIQPISKQEYQQYGKVINSAKYEEFKKKQEEKESKKDIKKEVKTENSRDRVDYHERKERREPSPRNSKDSHDYESSSRRRDRSRDRDTERSYERHRQRSLERSSERNRDRNRRSSSYDRNKSKDVDRSNRSRHENRRSRSTDRHKNSYSSNSRDDRSKDDKHRRRQDRSESSSKSSTSDSDSSDDSRHNKRSHHKKSKKKHKKKSSKKNHSSDDDRHVQKKTKKSKRERSRSRGRR